MLHFKSNIWLKPKVEERMFFDRSPHSHPVTSSPFISGEVQAKHFHIFNNQLAIATPVTVLTPHLIPLA